MAHPRSTALSEASCIKLCNSTKGVQPYDAAAQLYRNLGIPNPRRRRGLKKIHTRIIGISDKLCTLFDFACSRKDWRLCDVVTVTCVELCGDAVLCHNLLERGLLSRTLGMVNVDGSFMLLPLLSLLARHGDESVRSAVLEALTRIFANWRVPWHSYDYSKEHVLVVLRHCVSFATGPELPAAFSVSRVADLALAALEDSDVSYETIIHAIPILIACARACLGEEESKTRVRILDFLAVLLHSGDITLRFVSVWVFYHLQDSYRPFSPRRRQRQVLHYPELPGRDVPPGSEPKSTPKATAMLQIVLRKVLKDRDFHQFAVEMAHVLSNGPFNHSWDDCPEFVGSDTNSFDSWPSLLLEAVDALMRHEDPSHRDMADVLSLEHLVRAGPADAAASRAREVLERNAKHPYAHVILSEQSDNMEEALQVARQGLRLSDLTVYLRRRLEVSAIELSFAKAQTLLLQTGPSDWRRRQAGLEAMNVMSEHIESFILAASGNSYDLLPVADLSIVESLVLRGAQCSAGFEELKPLWNRVDYSAQSTESMGLHVTDSPMGRAHEALAQHFSQGFDKWATLIERFDKLDVHYRRPIYDNPFPPTLDPKTEMPQSSLLGHSADEDAFSRWWEPDNEPTLASLLHGSLKCSCYRDGSMQLTPGLPVLYACSWCSCRTAIVRKCSRCQCAWYCDAECQRAHWPEHRTVCRKPCST